MKKAMFILILSVIITAFGFSQANLQPAAIVNLIRSEPISVGQLRTEVERLEKAGGRTLTQAERLQVLDMLINERLVLQAAERDRVIITENEVNQQIQQLRNNLAQQAGRPVTDAEFSQAIMSESGLELPAFREQMRKQLILQKYIATKKEPLLNSIRMPTEQEIVTEYNLLKGNLVRPETVRVSMIQIPYGADAASRARARELGDRLVREIGSSPTKFDEVAARSVSPNSGYQAGDAGFLPRNQEARNLVGQELLNVVFSMGQGQVSSLVEGLHGFHIVKVTENYAQKNLELDDVIQLGTRVTVREYIGQGLLNQRQQQVIAQASQEVIAELRQGRSFQVFENNLNW